MAAFCRFFLLSNILFSWQALAQAPSFGAPVNLNAQRAPLAITAADFNKDGFQDLAIANAQSSTISIFLGNGKGQFSSSPPVALSSGCQAGYLTTGNFTGAASTDLLAVCPLGGFAILPNAGNGTFGAPISTSLPLGAWVGNLLLGSIHPAIADFNGDGRLDIAIPVFDQENFDGSWYVLLGNGNGTFQSARKLPFNLVIPVSLAAGDFNADKKLDLVTAGYDVNDNFILQFAAGNGDGSFAPPKSYLLPQAAGSIILSADLNGDAKLDVVVAGSSLYQNLNSLASNLEGSGASSQGSAAVTVMLGDGAGGFNQVFNAVETSYISGAALADVLGRGKLDLIETVIQGNFLAGVAPTGAVTLRLGNGDGTFGTAITLNVPSSTIPTDVTTADFNSDGFPDIAIASVPAVGITIGLDGLSGLGSLLQEVLAQLPIGAGEILLNTAVAIPPAPSVASVLNGADFNSEPLPAGAWISIFGQNLGQAGTWTSATTVTVGGAGVSICGVSSVLSFNSGPVTANGSTRWQINALMPDGVAGQTSCSVVVTVGGVSSQPVNVIIASTVMQLFGFTSSAGPLPIITHLDYSLVGPASAGLKPAQPNEILIAWGTGACSTPGVTVAGTPALVSFSGRVEPGLCQMNFVVPAGSTGNSQLKISTSPTVYSLWISG